jgi:hypothetical protein
MFGTLGIGVASSPSKSTSLTATDAAAGEVDGRGKEEPELGKVMGAIPNMVRLVEGGGAEWVMGAVGAGGAEEETEVGGATRADGGIVGTAVGIATGAAGAICRGGETIGGAADTRGATTGDGGGATTGDGGAVEISPRGGGAVETDAREGGGAERRAESVAMGMDA